MKIAFFTDTYLPNRDGVVASITSFKEELEKRGHKVYVFTSGGRKERKENKNPDVFYYKSATFKPYPQYKVALFPLLSVKKDHAMIPSRGRHITDIRSLNMLT